MAVIMRQTRMAMYVCVSIGFTQQTRGETAHRAGLVQEMEGKQNDKEDTNCQEKQGWREDGWETCERIKVIKKDKKEGEERRHKKKGRGHRCIM